LHEVQRRVLNDFAAQVQSTFHQQPTPISHPAYHETTWERESVDSLEASNPYHSPEMASSSKITGPIVRATPVMNTPPKRAPPSGTNHVAIQSLSVEDQQELLRRSYHESFFVKNTPVTGDEQVTAWLDVNRTGAAPAPHGNASEKPSSLDGTESEITRRRKSILKRSPSIDSNGVNPMVALRGTPLTRQGSAPQTRALGEKVRVKDSLEVINTKLLKDIDTQVNQGMTR
jgi:hypothetical protein